MSESAEVDLDALERSHADPQHGQYECVGYSEGQACCIDSIRPDLHALIQRLRQTEAERAHAIEQTRIASRELNFHLAHTAQLERVREAADRYDKAEAAYWEDKAHLHEPGYKHNPEFNSNRNSSLADMRAALAAAEEK